LKGAKKNLWCGLSALPFTFRNSQRFALGWYGVAPSALDLLEAWKFIMFKMQKIQAAEAPVNLKSVHEWNAADF
jgi:hypothetical protein